MKNEVLPVENDWSGLTSYYSDDKGERMSVPASEVGKFNQRMADSGRKVTRIPTRKYVDRAGEEFTVPEDRVQDFFYENAEKKREVAEVQEWESQFGEKMPVAMWKEDEAKRQAMKTTGIRAHAEGGRVREGVQFKPADEWKTPDSYRAKDLDDAVRDLGDVENWGVQRDEKGGIDVTGSAKEIGERLVRGTAGAAASVATGAAEMIGDLGVNAVALGERGIETVADLVGADGIAESVGNARESMTKGWGELKEKTNNAIVNDILGETITQGTKLGEDLARFGVGAGETYGEMALGLKAISKAAGAIAGQAGAAAAVPATFGIGGVEGTLEDPTMKDAGTKARTVVATVRGLADAFTGHVLGKIMNVAGWRGASKEMSRTMGKAIAVALGESVEGGVTMGAMAGADQLARGAFGIKDQMIDAEGNVTDDPEKAVGFREATAGERVGRAMNALLHGTVMTLGLKAAELTPKLTYRGGKDLTRAATYEVEMARKQYAPQVTRVAEAARAAMNTTGGTLREGVFRDVRGVSTNGEVFFNDGSTYYPAVAERMVAVTGRDGRPAVRTIPGRAAKIVVSDGTILDTAGNVVGKLAGGQRMERTVDTQAEAYARATDPSAATSVTVFDRETGRAADLPTDLVSIAPEAYREYVKWSKTGEGPAPKLDAESLAFSEIAERYNMGGDARHAAEMALGDIQAGRKTASEAADLLRRVDEKMAGGNLVELRGKPGETVDSVDGAADRARSIRPAVEGGVVVETKPGKNGEIARTAVDAAADLTELGKTGELKTETVDVTAIDGERGGTESAPAQDVGGERAPIFLRLDPETGKLVPVDGAKRIGAEKASGAKTVEAVVLRPEDGWTEENAEAVKIVGNITSGTLDAKGMVDGFAKLGMDLGTATQRGLIDAPERVPAGGPTQEWLDKAQARSRKIAALSVARNASPEVRERVTDGNLMTVSSIVSNINSVTFGKGWEAAQRAALDALEGVSGSDAYRATRALGKLGRFIADGTIDAREAAEVAKYYAANYSELKRAGLELNGVPSYEMIRDRMKNDAVATVPVVDKDGNVKSVGEVKQEEIRPADEMPDGVGTVKDWSEERPEPGLEMNHVGSDAEGRTVYGCEKFPEMKVTIGGGNVTISGVDAQDLTDSRTIYERAKVIGRLAELAESVGAKLQVPKGTEAQINWLLDYYETSVKTDAKSLENSRRMLELMERSGLSDGVIQDQEAFDAMLARGNGGERLVADGLTYGWTDGGKVYLNPRFFGTKAGLNTVIHEFGHLAWIKTKAVNPELYRRGMELAGEMTEALEALRKQPGYDRYTEDQLREELLVKMIGDRGEASLREIVPERLIDKVRAWVNEVWQSFGAQFGIADLTADKAERMTLADIADAVRAEMMSGRKFGEMNVGDAEGKRAAAIERSPAPSKENGGIARDAKPVSEEAAVSNGDTVVQAADGKMYSIKSMKYDLKESSMIDDLMKSGVWGDMSRDAVGVRKQAKEFKAGLEKLVKRFEEYIAKDAQMKFLLDMDDSMMDKDNGRPFSAWKSNSDPLYKISLDFSTLCKKRILTQYVIEKLSLKLYREGKLQGHDGKTKVLSAEHQMAIRKMLLDYQKIDNSLQVACHLCYVEAARLKAPKQINRFLADPARYVKAYFAKKNAAFDEHIKELQSKWKIAHGYSADTPKTEMSSRHATQLNEYSTKMRLDYKPTAEEQRIINESKDLSPENYLTADNLTKLSSEHRDIFNAYTEHVRQSTHSKSLETDVPYYYGDSVKAFSDKMRDKMGEQGTGFRHQSWSDFQFRHLLDTMTAVIDLSVRHAKMHAYTKVPDFAEIFGRTGVMINLSLIPKVDGSGFDANEGMDYKRAIELREKFPETCGTIAISMSDAHCVDLINNPNIDYVIPYHVSGMNRGLRKMVGIERWKDFTGLQHEQLKDGKSAKNGPELKDWLVTDGENGYDSMVKSAQKYLDVCTERGIKPKFADIPGLCHKESSGRWMLDNPNYWKLLVDHKMVNQETGKMIEQKAVRPDFKFGSDAKNRDGIDDILDRAVGEFDSSQMDKAYQYVESRMPELGKITSDLKRNGAYDKLVDEYRLDEDRRGVEPDQRMFNRPVIEFVDDRARVANDEGRGETTNGAIAASRQLSQQAVTPAGMVGAARHMSLPISELEWLRRTLTGNNVPAHVAKSLPGGAASASTRAGKLVIAADVFGIVDRTDMAREKANLKQHGYFRNEDPAWAAMQAPAAIRAEARRSEEQLANQLLALGDRRTNGQAGGESAARGVFADELANIIMEMPHVPNGGVVRNVRTIGDGIRAAIIGTGAVDQYRDQAGAFLDWAYGAPANGAPATRDLPAEELTNRMFGAWLVMPAEMAARAPEWSARMADAVTGDRNLLAAWRELTSRAMTEQATGPLEQAMRASLNRQTEETIANLEAEGEELIQAKTRSSRVKESLFVGFDDRMAPVTVRVNENAKIYRAAKLAAIKATRDPAIRAQLEQELARFEGDIGAKMNQMELSRLAFERGSYNEGRAYFIRETMLINEATQKQGLTLEDMNMYLDLNRVIETQGRAASRGMTPRQARIMLDAMERRLGAAKWTAMQTFAGKFHAIHEQEFLSDPRLKAAMGKGFVDYLETQAHYVTTARTWSPEELAGIDAARATARRLGANGGDDVVGQMFQFAGGHGLGSGEGVLTAKLVGSFADKKNVMAATWEKIDSAQQFLRRNQYVMDMRDLLLAAKVEGVRDVLRGDRDIPENKRYGRLNYMENGQAKTLIVPRQIADGFAVNPGAVYLSERLRGMWRKAIIDMNPAYWNRNINRNIGSIEKNMPGMRETWLKTALRPFGLGAVGDVVMTHLVRHVPGLSRAFGADTVFAFVPQAKRMATLLENPSAWQQRLWDADARGDYDTVNQMRGDLSETLRMLKANMLVPLRVNQQGGGSAGFVNDVLGKKNLKTIARMAEEYDQKSSFRKVVDAVNVFAKNAQQQQWEEDHAKIIAYLHDRMKFGGVRTEQESGRVVAENVSIGQGERSGTKKGVIQATLSSFFNMCEKGFKRNVKAHLERPGEMAVKDAKVVVGAALNGLVMTGVVSAIIRKMYGDDEKKIAESPLADAYRYAEFARRAGKNRSEYVKAMYQATPVWSSPSGETSVFIGMPYNDEDKQLAPIGQYIAAAIANKMGVQAEQPSAFDSAVKAATVSLMPDSMTLTGPEWTLLRDTVWAMFVGNPTDEFRGAKLYDEDLYANRSASVELAGQFGWEIAKQVWNDLGGRIVLEADRNGTGEKGPAEEPQLLSDVLRKIPVVSPFIRSFVKVQHGGVDKYAKPLTDAEKKRQALMRILRKEALDKSDEGRCFMLTDGYRARLAEWSKMYGLTPEETMELEVDMFGDWQARYPEAGLRDMKKRMTIEQKAMRQGVNPSVILD